MGEAEFDSVSRTGFEPVTKSLKGSCSTAELPAQFCKAKTINRELKTKEDVMLNLFQHLILQLMELIDPELNSG